jgi:hypothetical protein
MNEEQPPRRDGRAKDASVSSYVRHLRKQAERCFRLAKTLTNSADAERLKQLGQSFLDQARCIAAEQGEPHE